METEKFHKPIKNDKSGSLVQKTEIL
jgi:hypothetical protein